VEEWMVGEEEDRIQETADRRQKEKKQE